MGAALIVPLVVLIGLVVMWLAFGARKTRQQAASDATLPDDPYLRRDEELNRLRADHAGAAAENTTHPARRP